jgi:mono/diheme cytochrome c family protein
MLQTGRVRRWLFLCSSLLYAVAHGAANPAAESDKGSLLERGHYLARAADCFSCHSDPGGKPFAGGSPLATPFGTIYGPNITPDRKTGIGDWTRADFVRAVREGVRKDGAPLYPAMPYVNYTKITDADMDALWAYVRSVPAVAHTVPGNTFSFPFNVRRGLAVWQGLYFESGRFTPATDKDPVWNRGAYLVEALGHCDACHTPRNLAQATESQHYLTGAQIQGWYAPDIGNDPLSKIADWRTDELAAFFKTGRMPGNTKSFGPMQEVIHDSLRYLKISDLQAIAVYLKAQPPVTAHAATRVVMPADRMAAGQAAYREHCASCHQNDGKGKPGTVPALAGNSAVTSREPYDVIMAMLYGFQPQGSWAAMGSFASALTDDQISDVANYVRTAWGNGGLPNATPWMVGNWREKERVAPAEAHPALACPILPKDLMEPALGAGSDALKRAAADRATLDRLVGNYTAARPKASSAEVIEAMSSAYCRAISAAGMPQARMDASIAEFSQHVAISLSRGSS